ncbi:conserved hypothetical protein [Candidatus Terasakiella magnetica]|nr:conserved hypothetical protein [Candidatus Terasakiella magnetica]
MSTDVNERILANPKFAELTAKRNRFSVILVLSVLGIYYAYLFVAVMMPDTISQTLGAGQTMTIGLPAGFLVMIVSFIFTGIYVRRANSEFDDLSRALIEEAGQ